ncbi:MAG: helix-turn-helix domain-containing protein [Gammaproteobacteria bacterium]|nr:helix-turn-helix domain-containing protein [Gammaproteobacteria bacterium]
MQTPLNAREAAARLGISRQTFYRLINKGLISRGHKISARAVVWSAAEIDKYMADTFRPASPA